MQNIRAEILLPSADLSGDIDFFTNRLGLRMEQIFPADDPREAVLSGHGVRIRLHRDGKGSGGILRLRADDPVLVAGGATELASPGGIRVEITDLDPPVIAPPVRHSFVVRKLADKAPWVVGRAGMQYRDLIPDRLGGSIIASHIRIPEGGPVPDMVHFHKVGFQLIFCVRGWVDVVYEDQGPPIRLHAGDCFIQPPEIRHRVLHSSDNLEVIEVGLPAEHLTIIDHAMSLPTADLRPEREWQGQKFVHHRADKAAWAPFRLPGFQMRDTTISANTRGVAGVQVARPDGATTVWASHDADIQFTYVMSGRMHLEAQDGTKHVLEQGDAFVIPPGMITRYTPLSEDLELIEVSLPGDFATTTKEPE